MCSDSMRLWNIVAMVYIIMYSCGADMLLEAWTGTGKEVEHFCLYLVLYETSLLVGHPFL